MNIEIIESETIKPSSPTLKHLKSFKLCLLDQLGAPAYFPLILFYPKNHVTTEEIRHKLKKSLSEALTRFYPLSGRIESNTSIECEDYGVPFIEARIHSSLSSFLQHPDMEVLQRFLPIEIESQKAITMPLLLVQLNFFDCGGLAIGLCVSHRFADASTLCTFIKHWAAISAGHSQTQIPVLHFDHPLSFFPTRPLGLRLPPSGFERPIIVTKRYVFDASKIAALKAQAVSPLVQRPSRTEAVTALLWKCAMAAKKSNTGISEHVLVQFVNVRKRVYPPLPENSIGNLILASSTAHAAEQSEKTELKDLVVQMRKGIAEFDEMVAKKLGGDDSLELIEEYRKERVNKEIMNLYSCTSWCNFGFYGGAEFGWGKPIWMSMTANACSTNYFRLIDTKEGDGVEAWVTLSEDDMALFECDPQLLSFALSNPSVV